MKKIITMALCLTLLGMALLGLAQPASAAGNAHMSIRSSAGTLYRGDTFTLTVSLSNDQPISNGGVILSYDSSAFEFLGGKCHVSNATLAEVSASRNGGVFVLQTDAVVSGTIFTINMRVKDTASFGSHSISGSASLSIPCSLSGTSVTVACRHSWGGCTNVDGENHQRVCSICGEKKTEAHAWDGGTVTKAATCKDTGVKKLTCTGCGATKEETIPVSKDHKYGKWTSTGDKHTHTCSVCNKKETVAHTWNSGTVLEKANCLVTGVLKLTCTGCGETKTETIPKTGHAWGECVPVDDTNHKRICADCAVETTEAHAYGGWEHDGNWHFRSCQGCGSKAEQAAHVPGPKATETTDQICTVCQRILQPKGAHVHSFSEDWSTDELGHWYACGDCNEKDSAAPHEFDDGCDADCNICGMTRQPAHVPAADWSAEEDGHWYACQDCGEKVGFDAHTAGPAATISSPQNCTVCGFEMAPVVPHDHIYDSKGTFHGHYCACGEAYEAEAGDCEVCATFPWGIVCILETVLFCGAGAAALLWLKKRGLLEQLLPTKK